MPPLVVRTAAWPSPALPMKPLQHSEVRGVTAVHEMLEIKTSTTQVTPSDASSWSHES